MNIRPDVANSRDKASLASEKNTDAALNALHNEFTDFIVDVEALSQKTSAIPHEDLKAIREQLNQRISRAKTSVEASARSATESVQQNTKKIMAAANQQAHNKPFYLLGVGAVIAAALGFAIGLRRRT
ncbi:MAG: hypothetical protein NVV73_04905 [Cellvibrionaceae bacterium]|nr:hypothetical protein [Cellvibrionaceae bacterium]